MRRSAASFDALVVPNSLTVPQLGNSYKTLACMPARMQAPSPYPGLVTDHEYYSQLETYMGMAERAAYVPERWKTKPVERAKDSALDMELLSYMPQQRFIRPARMHQMGNPYRQRPDVRPLLAAVVYRPEQQGEEPVPVYSEQQIAAAMRPRPFSVQPLLVPGSPAVPSTPRQALVGLPRPAEATAATRQDLAAPGTSGALSADASADGRAGQPGQRPAGTATADTTAAAEAAAGSQAAAQQGQSSDEAIVKPSSAAEASQTVVPAANVEGTKAASSTEHTAGTGSAGSAHAPSPSTALGGPSSPKAEARQENEDSEAHSSVPEPRKATPSQASALEESPGTGGSRLPHQTPQPGGGTPEP